MSDRAGKLDGLAIARAFERASAGYDAHSIIASTARTEMLARLELLAFTPGVVVDLGTGTGHGARALKDRWPSAKVLALDLSAGMLREARRRRSWRRRFALVRADAARLPFAIGTVDLVFSNLLLPWSVDLDAQLLELRRVLSPRGYLSFSTLGPDTLKELRVAWEAVDGAEHVHPFFDMHDIGDALVRAGFADPVMDVDRYTLTYPDVPALVTELRGLGARNSLNGRAAGLGARGRGEQLAGAYERFRTEDGRLPASCELIYGQAWCPGGTPPIRQRRGEVVVPVGSIGRR